MAGKILFKYTRINPVAPVEYYRKIKAISVEEYRRAIEELRRDSPVGVSALVGQPSLREGWDLIITDRYRDLRVQISNNTPNSIYRLEGRRAGKAPPTDKLMPWVRLKLKVPKNRVKQVAFLIARKIAREGTTRSKRNFRQFDPATGKPAKNSAIARANKRVSDQIAKIKI